MKITRSIYQSPFGPCLIGMNKEGICELSFVDEVGAALPEHSLFRGETPTLSIQGTPFQMKVWEALLKIPKGQTRSYADIARSVGSPKAVRAVGTACGKNKIAFLIPCHRVLASSGKLGGYRWGLDRKKAMLDWEAAH
ncbi:MAG: methylated-DNA--[protein]-cysteine S-methyltransferase [Patescibacteria group bacterium]